MEQEAPKMEQEAPKGKAGGSWAAASAAQEEEAHAEQLCWGRRHCWAPQPGTDGFWGAEKPCWIFWGSVDPHQLWVCRHFWGSADQS